MRLVDIPPYRGAGYEYNPKEGPWIRELIENLRERGQLEGVEVEIDEGHFTDHKYETRNEEVWANLAPGFLKRVRECSESGRYDAIICHVPIDEGAIAAQFVSKIPVALALHSAVHFASFIGDRFSIIDISDQHGPRQRHLVQNYGLNHKLMSIRTIDRTSSQVMRLVRQYPKGERAAAPGDTGHHPRRRGAGDQRHRKGAGGHADPGVSRGWSCCSGRSGRGSTPRATTRSRWSACSPPRWRWPRRWSTWG